MILWLLCKRRGWAEQNAFVRQDVFDMLLAVPSLQFAFILHFAVQNIALFLGSSLSTLWCASFRALM